MLVLCPALPACIMPDMLLPCLNCYTCIMLLRCYNRSRQCSCRYGPKPWLPASFPVVVYSLWCSTITTSLLSAQTANAIMLSRHQACHCFPLAATGPLTHGTKLRAQRLWKDQPNEFAGFDTLIPQVLPSHMISIPWYYFLLIRVVHRSRGVSLNLAGSHV